MTTIPMLAATMSQEQQSVFYAQLAGFEKDEVAGVLLALFLGSFGAHHFYLRRTGLGVAYLLFFWTGIPGLLGLVECFLMPSRVQRFNLEQALTLAGSFRGIAPPLAGMPLLARHCATCGAVVAGGVRFCAQCGAQMA